MCVSVCICVCVYVIIAEKEKGYRYIQYTHKLKRNRQINTHRLTLRLQKHTRRLSSAILVNTQPSLYQSVRNVYNIQVLNVFQWGSLCMYMCRGVRAPLTSVTIM